MLRWKKVVPREEQLRSHDRITYHSGEVIKASGIYLVKHRNHRLPHEVTLLADQKFPRCEKCAEAVLFEQIATVHLEGERRGRILLYELPEIDRATNRSVRDRRNAA